MVERTVKPPKKTGTVKRSTVKKAVKAVKARIEEARRRSADEAHAISSSGVIFTAP